MAETSHEAKITTWVRWTIAQGLSGTLNRIIQKLVGTVGTSAADAGFATMVIGLTQIVLAALASRIRNTSLRAPTDVLVGSLVFGVFSYAAGMLSFLTFLYGGAVGVATFLLTLSIVPGAFIDWMFFGYRLHARQWLGVLFAILAGYFVLGMPSLAEAARLPLWVWLALANGLVMAVNQGVSQRIQRGDVFVSNFWMGVPLAVLSALTTMFLLIFHPAPLSAAARVAMLSVVYGIIMLGYIIFNLLAFRGGARIAIKKLVFNGTLLITSVIVGILFFREPLTLTLFAGIVLYLAGYVLLQREAGTKTV